MAVHTNDKASTVPHFETWKISNKYNQLERFNITVALAGQSSALIWRGIIVADGTIMVHAKYGMPQNQNTCWEAA